MTGNSTNIGLTSKRNSLVILGVTAILCSRALFYFFNDPEGPNLLIVVMLAMVVYLLSLGAYVFTFTRIKGTKKLAVVICVQVLFIVALYFFMK